MSDVSRDASLVRLSLPDRLTQAKFFEWLGREPHPSAAGRAFFHIRAPNEPQLRFEWHPKIRKLYVVRLAVEPPTADCIAEHVETHGDSINYVQTYLRGLREGRAAPRQGFILER